MFTGIIETTGIVKSIIDEQTNKVFWIETNMSKELKIDESISHNGVCLTIEEIKNNQHRVTAIHETINKTNMGQLQIGATINIERAMKMNGRIDGHIVQGHIDGTGRCIQKKDLNGSIQYTFSFHESNAALIIEKGSICVNGVSLTAFDVTKNYFTVAIIPYTLEHTNFKNLQEGNLANLEFDMLGKYVLRIIQLNEMK